MRSTAVVWVLIVLGQAFACAWMGGEVSGRAGQDRVKGQILGFLFGLIGLFAVVVMTREPRPEGSAGEHSVPAGERSVQGFWATDRSYWIIVGVIAAIFLVAYLVSSWR